MSIYEIYQAGISSGQAYTVGVVLIIILSMIIRIPKLDVNIWGWLVRWLGKNFNYSIKGRLDEINKKLDENNDEIDGVRDALEEHKADEARTRILRFGDEMLHGTRHSKDSWTQIARDIKNYNNYCTEHPKYENNVTGPTSERIMEIYTNHIDDPNFFV